METKEIEMSDMSKVDVKVINDNEISGQNDTTDPIDLKTIEPEPVPIETEPDGTMTPTAVIIVFVLSLVCY